MSGHRDSRRSGPMTSMWKLAASVAGAIALSTAAGAASAAVFDWSFLSDGGADSGQGTFTTNGLGEIVSGFGDFHFTTAGLGDFTAPLYANPNPGAWST